MGVSGSVLSSDLSDGMVVETLNGSSVTIDLTDGVKVNDVTVTSADVLASNGVIHIVGGVLVPPGTDVGGFLATCQATSSPVAPPTPAPIVRNTRSPVVAPMSKKKGKKSRSSKKKAPSYFAKRR